MFVISLESFQEKEMYIVCCKIFRSVMWRILSFNVFLLQIFKNYQIINCLDFPMDLHCKVATMVGSTTHTILVVTLIK